MSPSGISPDARAVVRAFDGLTTQARRIADALTTPVVEHTDATDDGPTTTPVACPLCPITVHLTTPDQATAHFRDEHPEERLTLWPWPVRVPTADGPRCVQCGSPDVRYRNYREQPFCWPCANGDPQTPGVVKTSVPIPRPAEVVEDERPLREQLRADEEQTLRLLRREGLLVLLSRLQRGRPVTEAEANTLRQHVETEIREADTARQYERSAWEATAHVLELKAAIERVRAVADQWDNALAPAKSQYSGPVRAALEGAEQPASKLPYLGANPGPPTATDASLPAKLDEATATLRRIRAVIRSWEHQALPHSQAHRLLVEVRDALAGPHPDPQPEESP
ncbi:hypothetical protein ACFZB4_18435 [Streptomyces pseudovenezuelae]|uniref:hypothetical protein n=1 Tax=Streptomyces pseudovenezuelae TaxID=67350 RepID=UPI0036E0E646